MQDDINKSDEKIRKIVSQQINFLRFIPKEQKNYLNATQIFLFSFIFMFILGVYSIISYHQKANLVDRVAFLKLEQKELTEKLAKASTKARATKEHVGGDAIAEMLKTYRFNNGDGFSHYLEAISKCNKNNVWLSSIFIRKKDNSILLDGNAYDANEVVQFAENLNKNSLFAEKPFYLAKMGKIKNSAGREIYSFVLKTQLNLKEEQ